MASVKVVIQKRKKKKKFNNMSRQIKRSKYWITMVDILDGQFPKHECKERGRAIVLLSYIELMLKGIKFNKNGSPIDHEKN